MIKKTLLLVSASIAISSAHAATFNFVDRGLSYTIDTTNPLLATVNFDALAVTTGAQSDSGNGANDTAFTVTVGSVSFVLPETGPLGLDIDPSGVATACCNTQSIGSIVLEGTYSAERNGTEISGSWTQTIANAGFEVPRIGILDFPNTAPLLSDARISTSFVIEAPDFSENEDFFFDIDWQTDQFGTTTFNAMTSVPVPPALLLFSSAFGMFGWLKRSKNR
ncbi:MAG: hypothetical protein AB8G16_00775 [Gammaproteobacteria bacterium]